MQLSLGVLISLEDLFTHRVGCWLFSSTYLEYAGVLLPPWFVQCFLDSPDFAQGVQFWFLLCTYFPGPDSGLEWPWKPQTLKPVISPVPDIYYVSSMWRYPFLLLSTAIYVISNNTCSYSYMFGNVAFN